MAGGCSAERHAGALQGEAGSPSPREARGSRGVAGAGRGGRAGCVAHVGRARLPSPEPGPRECTSPLNPLLRTPALPESQMLSTQIDFGGPRSGDGRRALCNGKGRRLQIGTPVTRLAV